MALIGSPSGSMARPFQPRPQFQQSGLAGNARMIPHGGFVPHAGGMSDGSLEPHGAYAPHVPVDVSHGFKNPGFGGQPVGIPGQPVDQLPGGIGQPSLQNLLAAAAAAHPQAGGLAQQGVQNPMIERLRALFGGGVGLPPQAEQYPQMHLGGLAQAAAGY